MPRSYSRTPGSWLFYGTDLVSCTMVVWSAHLCCFGRGYKRHGWGCGCRNYKYYQLPYKVKVWDTHENTKCCYCYQQCLISLVNIDKFTILKTFLTVVVNLFFCFFLDGWDSTPTLCTLGRLGIEWLCPHQGASRLWDVGRCAKQGGQEGRQRRATATHW